MSDSDDETDAATDDAGDDDAPSDDPGSAVVTAERGKPVDGSEEFDGITYPRAVAAPTVRLALDRRQKRTAFRPSTVD